MSKRRNPRETIDLCEDDEPELALQRCSAKRRRAALAPHVDVVDIENDDVHCRDSDEVLARRLQQKEREQLRADRDADERFARQLQREEDSSRFALHMGLFGGEPVTSAPGGARWDRSQPGNWFSEFLGNNMSARTAGRDLYPPSLMPPPRRWGGGSSSGRAGQLAHLSFLDRDFNETDYEMLLQLDEQDGPKRKEALRANAKAIDSLPTRRLTRADGRAESVCAICLENMRAQQQVLTLPCRHEYHKACILKWLKNNEVPSCPTCKAPALLAHGAKPCGSPKPASPGDEEWHHT